MDVFATGHGSPSPEYGRQIVPVPDGRPRRIPHEVSEAFRRAAVPAGGAGERVGP